MQRESLLEIKNLKVYFYLEEGIARVLEGISLGIKEGEFFALVGESGCGKTIFGLSILNLVPAPGKIVEGEINFAGKNLRSLSKKDWQALRGKEITMVFQEPLAFLNPVLSIGVQMTEMLNTHLKMNKREARLKALELLKNVGLAHPALIWESYPHQLSGGMRQRVMIAMSLSCGPKFLILDEPTTALDTTIQAQILELILRIKKETRLTALFITHDLAIVEGIADKVAIMYLGKLVETGKTEEIFQNPFHPYTRKLFACLLELNRPKTFLNAIPGQVPEAINRPAGCPFHPRCERKIEICVKEFPPETESSETHRVWCYNPFYR
ncbi:MAG: ABC transporter ATP-binding protein [Candidatus Omnitrophica bacterium]|nr:ABC transporter ATP-binding protein [Candidatus Omnitrophota bacterium]MCM8798387.1 ABC transporter ATP-binding protein [Candidatus Omnitrophota bacterium]